MNEDTLDESPVKLSSTDEVYIRLGKENFDPPTKVMIGGVDITGVCTSLVVEASGKEHRVSFDLFSIAPVVIESENGEVVAELTSLGEVREP